MASGVKLDSYDHIGLVVKDCEATIGSWSSLLGIGPWTVRDVDIGGPDSVIMELLKTPEQDREQ